MQLRRVLGIAAAAVLISGQAAVAEEVVQVWTCQISEGKTEADVKAANDQWVRYVNETVEGGGIESAAGFALVGDTSEFVYIDRFPSLQTWTDVQRVMQEERAQPIEEALDAAAPCNDSSLYRMVPSG